MCVCVVGGEERAGGRGGGGEERGGEGTRERKRERERGGEGERGQGRGRGRGGEGERGRGRGHSLHAHTSVDTKATVTTQEKNRQEHTSEHGELWCIVIGVQDANSDVGRVLIEGRSSVSGSHEERVRRSGLIVQCLRRGREDR